MIAALVDGLKASPEFISSTSFSQTLINFSQKYLPLSDIGMGWVVLSLIGFIIGFIIYKLSIVKCHKHNTMPQSYVKHMLVAFFIHTTLNCTRIHINDYPRKY
ncbi:branched-chain amino acid transport system carrier protein [Staphylococcus aureus]|uniref:Branched-chain amino acid transport system carrier protein n=1 Tax=Staphylococcus aureus TaxID=1280 RepID=A0A380DN46_STAAU|nr:branched-chain amino acid transport system carrier protein [Staphylococcus aureus]